MSTLQQMKARLLVLTGKLKTARGWEALSIQGQINQLNDDINDWDCEGENKTQCNPLIRRRK